MKSDFTSKFGIPRQSNVVKGLKSVIVFEPEYRNVEALRGLDTFSHLWIIWGFSETARDTWSPTVRPPRLGGNTRMGVFATRSPFRPNPIGLSNVKLERIEQHPNLGPLIHVLGADLMNGTPIYDIKPYLPYADCIDDANGGFASSAPEKTLRVVMDETCQNLFSVEDQSVLRDVLSYDPRPSYQDDATRVYGMAFGAFDVRFTVDGDTLTVCEIAPKIANET